MTVLIGYGAFHSWDFRVLVTLALISWPWYDNSELRLLWTNCTAYLNFLCHFILYLYVRLHPQSQIYRLISSLSHSTSTFSCSRVIVADRASSVYELRITFVHMLWGIYCLIMVRFCTGTFPLYNSSRVTGNLSASCGTFRRFPGQVRAVTAQTEDAPCVMRLKWDIGPGNKRHRWLQVAWEHIQWRSSHAPHLECCVLGCVARS